MDICGKKEPAEWAGSLADDGAEDGTRTRDPNLGKVMLYQLSHFRATGRYNREAPRRTQALFQKKLFRMLRRENMKKRLAAFASSGRVFTRW